jgi:hypothetical protein
MKGGTQIEFTTEWEKLYTKTDRKYKSRTGFVGLHTRGYKLLRGLIFVRDNCRCRLCRSTLHLDTHHLDSNRKNSDYLNQVTLCRACHHCWKLPKSTAFLKELVKSTPIPTLTKEELTLKLRAIDIALVGSYTPSYGKAIDLTGLSEDERMHILYPNAIFSKGN